MKRLSLLPSLLLAALLGVGCATAPKPAPTPEAVSGPRAMLWEVKSASGATAYVVGSVHMGRDGQLELPPSIESAFSRADTLVVELDVTTLDKVEMQKLVFRYGMLPRGQKLSDRLNGETEALLVPALQRVGLPRAGVEPMRPWLVSLTLATLELSKSGYAGGNGVDQSLLTRVHASADSGLRVKDIIPLETAEQQLATLADLPDALQDLMLREQLQREGEQSTESLEKLITVWRAGDAEGLASLLFPTASDAKYQPVYEKVFYERNEHMARRVDALLREQPRTHFVVVGAGHVVGPRGLPALLQRQGYTVRQLGRDSLP
jgi:uncharacterized protein YbaP (TraB family)